MDSPSSSPSLTFAPLPDGLEATLVSAALQAGNAISAHYAKGPIAVEHKADCSPVTQADMDAETLILDVLRTAFPGIPVISEEEASAGKSPEVADRFFLVDPLDGTKEFIKRNGEFTVNIALIDSGVPVAGVVYAPELGELFYGDHSQGAWLGAVKDAVLQARVPLAIRDVPADGSVVVASRSHMAEKTKNYMDKHAFSRRMQAGSSLKFCLVAAGRADVYPRHSPTMQWDTAAGHAVLRAAGGSVMRECGQPLLYGKQTPGAANAFKNPSFIAVGCQELAKELAEDADEESDAWP